MSSEIVILLAVGERGGKGTAFGRTQVPEVEKPLLSKRPSLPAHHAGRGDGNPIDATGFIRKIPAYFRETLTPEQLALAGNVLLPFKAIGLGVVALFSENGSRNTKARIFFKLAQEKFEMILVKGNVSV